MYIAFAGKGSSGKSTIVASPIAWLHMHTTERPLVIDADPHQSLCTLLNVWPPTTLGSLRSQYERALLTGRDAALRADETRITFAERLLAEEALYPTEHFDLLALGQWELPGSQCIPNRVLGYALSELLPHYALTIVDHEAGIEHIGRFRDVPIDRMIVIATPDMLSLDVARRVLDQAHLIGREIRSAALFLNRVQQGDLDDEAITQQLEQLRVAGLPLLAALPESAGLRASSRGQLPLAHLAPHDPWFQALYPLLDHLFPDKAGA